MATRPIVQITQTLEDSEQNGSVSILRQVAKPVPHSLFGTPELAQIITDMADTLDGQTDGVALAAPQISIPYRIFIVRYDRTLPMPAQGEPAHPPEIGVFINPRFIRASRRRAEMDEGCLSVRGLYGTTLRHERATIKAHNAAGKSFERGGGGLLAQIFQHESDHLDGILFIDHALDIVSREYESVGADPKKHQHE